MTMTEALPSGLLPDAICLPLALVRRQLSASSLKTSVAATPPLASRSQLEYSLSPGELVTRRASLLAMSTAKSAGAAPSEKYCPRCPIFIGEPAK